MRGVNFISRHWRKFDSLFSLSSRLDVSWGAPDGWDPVVKWKEVAALDTDMTTRTTQFELEALQCKSLLVSEIYASIQGESTHAGRRCTFVRLTGCPLRCSWCDSAYAFRGGERMSLESIIDRVNDLGISLIEVTGGEPLAQSDCLPLLKALCDLGCEVLLETSGALDISDVDPRVKRIVDLKCPASGEVDANRFENYEFLGKGDEIKCVIANRDDFDWAVGVVRDYSLAERVPVLFSPVTGFLDPAQLAAWIQEEGLDVRLQLQLHKYLWPDVERSV